MKYRKRNRMLIGILCCTLIFMGIGYAVMHEVLTIESTANVTGDFNIHFLNDDQNKKGITLIDYENSTEQNTVYKTSVTEKAIEMESGTGVGNDPSTATFSAIFKSPSDYATFTATVKNYGTIKGRISSVDIVSTPSQALADWLSEHNSQWSDYFEITTTAAVDTVINPDAEYEFTITVTFKSGAELLPQGALNNSITITYVQDNGQAVTPQVVYVDQDDSCFVSFIDGEINYYDTSKQGCGSSVTIPDNLRLKTSTVTGYTFNSQLCLYFAGDIKYTMGYGEATDEQFCDAVEDMIDDLYAQGQDDLYETYFGAFLTPTYTTPSDGNGTYNLITKVGATGFSIKNISSVSISNNITQIGASAFSANALTTLTIPNTVTSIADYAFAMNSSLAAVNLGTGVTTIGRNAFSSDAITSLTIPSSVTTIGRGAFYGNGMTTLNLSNASSLTTIDEWAFQTNNISSLTIPSSIITIGTGAFYDSGITTLNLSNASSLTTIGTMAFQDNYLTGTLAIPSSVQTIGDQAFYVNRLTTLDLSNSNNLASIGHYAFASQYDANSNPTLETINASNKAKSQYDTITNNQTWYYASHSNFHITYSDVTCDGNGNCTAN